MRLLARIFSALALLSLLASAAALIWPRPTQSPSPPPGIEALVKVEKIVVVKSSHRMLLFQNGKAVREYRVALGPTPTGDKLRQGDGRTPEGVFHIDRKNAASAFHLSLGLDYPQAEDRARALAGGYDPGGDIMIHGQPNGLPEDTVIAQDWTAGCIAVSNAEIAEIYAATEIGTEVLVTP